MGNPPRYGGLDAFKVIAALLVVAIHTSPLTTTPRTGTSCSPEVWPGWRSPSSSW